MYGHNIQSAADQLQKVQEQQLFYALVHPKPEIASAMQQLRTVYTLDKSGYAQLKRTLPYVVCGMFNPSYRRTENFAYTERFILDFDHLSAKQLALDELRAKICSDNRVLMCFASPSKDGLKVMFSLKERCHDRGLYTLFYKAFASSFARQLGLEQVLDAKTSDVTRACFISTDEKAVYNADAEPVDLTAFVDTNNPTAVFDLKHEEDKAEKEQKAAAQLQPVCPGSADPTADVMARIRATLRPNAPIVKKEAYVPGQLDDIIGPLCNTINKTGIQVTEVVNIQYAKKIRARLGLKQAELNLFFGKRGYSVVKSPRRGTDDELNQLLADIVQAFLANPGELPY